MASEGEVNFDRLRVVTEVMKEDNVKYEINKEGDLEVNRVIPGGYIFPANYGEFEKTLADDGDPLDALVLGPRILPGKKVWVHPIAMLDMEDSGKRDCKVVCHIANGGAGKPPLTEELKGTITEFFKNYKNLEPAHKYTIVKGWATKEEMREVIQASFLAAAKA